MARYLLFILLLLIPACAPQGTRPLLPVEQDIASDTFDQYNTWAAENDYPLAGDECYNALMGEVVLVVHSHEEMLAATGHCGPDTSERPNFEPFDGNEACPDDSAYSVWAESQYGYVDHSRVVVIADVSDWCYVLPHEFLHTILRCVGMNGGHGDSAHTDPIWSSLHFGHGETPTTRGPEFSGFLGCR